jgi:hypothetical protein
MQSISFLMKMPHFKRSISAFSSASEKMDDAQTSSELDVTTIYDYLCRTTAWDKLPQSDF